LREQRGWNSFFEAPKKWNMNQVKISLMRGDALLTVADILVLKYAQAPHGLDRTVIRKFAASDNPVDHKLPPSETIYLLTAATSQLQGMCCLLAFPPWISLGTRRFVNFSRNALTFLASLAPGTRSVAITIHGAGYGLDETEAFESQIAGFTDSITSGMFPKLLEDIIIVEQSEGRVQRLQAVLKTLFPDGILPTRRLKVMSVLAESSAEILEFAGRGSESKKSIFVAMPFSEDFDDVFYFGIQGAVNAAGYLCERADLQSFTGDIWSG
jgi:hypothetical protein